MARHDQSWRTCDVCGEEYDPDMLPKFMVHEKSSNEQGREMYHEAPVRIWRRHKEVRSFWHILKTPQAGLYSAGLTELDLCLAHRTAVEEALTV